MTFPDWRTYLAESRSFYYSLFLVSPLLIIYEAGTVRLFANRPFELRNAADAFLRFILEQVGIEPGHYFSLIFFIVLALVLFMGIYREGSRPLISIVFPMMLVEGLIWGFALVVVLQSIASLTLGVTPDQQGLTQINLALGAGLYEELVFRVILISAIGMIFKHGFSWNKRTASWAGLMGAAAIFAGFHLFTEVFEWSAFIQRFAGGLLLGLLYLNRGYGLAVYGHVFYNLIILFYL